MNPITRRRFVAGSVSLATMFEVQRAAQALGLSATAGLCKLNAEQEIGPYYVVDEELRSDLREGKPGVPLELRLAVLDARTCTPLQGAAIDVWHCDALGLYSGFTATNPTGAGPGFPPPGGGPPPGGDRFGAFDPQHSVNHPGPPEGMGPPPAMRPTDKLTFLRGVQLTDAHGVAVFQTIFPGFYMGRTNHIHFKVRVDGHAEPRKTGPRGAGQQGAGQTYAAGHTSHTGQVFFPEELTTQLMQQEPYSQHRIHRTTQAEDGIFADEHGAESVAILRPLAMGSKGFRAELVAVVDPTATPKPVGMGGGPGPRRGPRP